MAFRQRVKLPRLEDTKNIPVVILSSKNMESDRAEVDAGCKEFLVKPVKQDELCCSG
ncbi:MAG: hypothetical protein R3E08_11885 [Thiotrichaceae bacterium]